MPHAKESSVRLDFYPRPPRGGRPRLAMHRLSLPEISIHALREEGDSTSSGPINRGRPFLSTPSARRATGNFRPDCCLGQDFYPRPPRGGRRHQVQLFGSHGLFLSTPSARRATSGTHSFIRWLNISIHALREEGDIRKLKFTQMVQQFLSTPSARRATSAFLPRKRLFTNFYPRPPRGGRPTPVQLSLSLMDFYPRPPRGGRPRRRKSLTRVVKFLSTPSARRATCTYIQRLGGWVNFYPRPPRGGRLQRPAERRRTGNFYPRPPRGGRPGGLAGDHHPLRNFYPRPPRGGRHMSILST